MSILLGDAETLLKTIPDESIDLVFTDPPYPRKYFHTFEILANECPRIMKPGASLITLLGHYSLEDVITTFAGKLKFRWILEMQQHEGSHPRMLMGIEVMWKPALWYVKGSFKNIGFLRDGVPITAKDGQEKKLHRWQQSKQWSDYYIPRLCPPGGIVLDPFCGSGTFLLSAKESNRNYLGIEIDEKEYNKAVERLRNV